MSLSVYYEDSKVCDARSILKTDVEACSKGILAIAEGHGKSPCFSRCCFSMVFGVDGAVSVFVVVEGGFFLV